MLLLQTGCGLVGPGFLELCYFCLALSCLLGGLFFFSFFNSFFMLLVFSGLGEGPLVYVCFYYFTVLVVCVAFSVSEPPFVV